MSIETYWMVVPSVGLALTVPAWIAIGITWARRHWHKHEVRRQ